MPARCYDGFVNTNVGDLNLGLLSVLGSIGITISNSIQQTESHTDAWRPGWNQVGLWGVARLFERITMTYRALPDIMGTFRLEAFAT
ncbi:unnamed protein product [Arctogadus glacialis]